jgi:peptidoglycan/LPS O-acetylase OafA/YrhL
MSNTLSDRNTHLDGLRGLAAFVVVIVHGIIAFDFAFYTGLAKDSIFSWDVSISGAPLLIPMAGNLSVCVFFVLSGYVLSHSFSKTTLGVIALLLKRYIRLTLPILSTCMISYALLAGGLMQNHSLAIVSKSTWLADQMQQSPAFSQALQEGLYGALITGSASYNSSLWTMPIELWGSIILIAVFRLSALGKTFTGTPKNDRIIILFVLGVLGFSSYLGLFAFGALLNLTQIHRKVSPLWAAIFLGVGVFLGTIPYSAVPWSIVRPFVVQTIPTIPGIPYAHSSVSFFHSLGAILILIAANSYLPFRRMLSTQLFRFLGEISFPLYLIHIPLLMSVVCTGALTMLNNGLPYAWTMASSLLIFIGVSIFVASGLLQISERPSIALSNWIGLTTDHVAQKATAFTSSRLRPPRREALND